MQSSIADAVLVGDGEACYAQRSVILNAIAILHERVVPRREAMECLPLVLDGHP